MSSDLLTFREIQKVDLPEVALLIERANAQRDHISLPITPSGLDTASNIQNKINRPGAWTDLAIIDQKAAGICLGYPVSETRDLPPEYTDGEYVSLLMVEPVHWGERIASILLDRAAERIRQKNKQHLILLTRGSDNDHARGMYEHKGFRLTGDVRSSEYGAQVLYVMDL